MLTREADHRPLSTLALVAAVLVPVMLFFPGPVGETSLANSVGREVEGSDTQTCTQASEGEVLGIWGCEVTSERSEVSPGSYKVQTDDGCWEATRVTGPEDWPERLDGCVRLRDTAGI